MSNRLIPQAAITSAEIAPYLPDRPDKPLQGDALRVFNYVREWLCHSAPSDIVPFVVIAHHLGIGFDKMRSIRWNHQGFNRAMASLGLEEVVIKARAVGYRRRPLRPDHA